VQEAQSSSLKPNGQVGHQGQLIGLITAFKQLQVFPRHALPLRRRNPSARLAPAWLCPAPPGACFSHQPTDTLGSDNSPRVGCRGVVPTGPHMKHVQGPTQDRQNEQNVLTRPHAEILGAPAYRPSAVYLRQSHLPKSCPIRPFKRQHQRRAASSATARSVLENMAKPPREDGRQVRKFRRAGKRALHVRRSFTGISTAVNGLRRQDCRGLVDCRAVGRLYEPRKI